MRKNVMFSSLGADVIEAVVDSMTLRSVSPDVQLIQSGEEATEFFVVESGFLDVIVDSAKVCLFMYAHVCVGVCASVCMHAFVCV